MVFKNAKHGKAKHAASSPKTAASQASHSVSQEASPKPKHARSAPLQGNTIAAHGSSPLPRDASSNGELKDHSSSSSLNQQSYASFPVGSDVIKRTSKGNQSTSQQTSTLPTPYVESVAPIRSDSNKYSRHATGKYNTSRKKMGKGKVALVAILCTCVVLLGCAGAAWAYLNHTVQTVNENLHQNLDADLQDSLVKTDAATEPFYVLLLGTDQSIQRDENGETDGTYRTDSIILARVDASKKQVTMVSIPRDSQVELEGHGTQKINAAYAFGGSSLAVDTISTVAGVGISHFAMVDMDGLKAVVDALGGIEVNVPIEINDPDAGGHLDAGLQTLSGDQALILARSRHAYDEYGDGDAYRAADQRLVLQAIAQKMLSCDPIKLSTLVTDLSQYVTTDFNVSDLVALAMQMRGMDASNSIWTATMPTEPVYENKIWYNIIDYAAWRSMMARVDAGLAPTEADEIDPVTGVVISSTGNAPAGATPQSVVSTPSDNSASGEGEVFVLNGTNTAAVAKKVSATLINVGYNVVGTGDANASSYSHTVVLYASDEHKQQAEAIAQKIGKTAVAQRAGENDQPKADITVIVGKDNA